MTAMPPSLLVRSTDSTAISILMVGYNSAAFLNASIGSIEMALQRHAGEIRFVNNGSDASEELVGKAFPHVSILPSLGNIGFGAANNYLAREARGAWLLLLNPDTELEESAIDILLEAAAANPDYAVLGGLSVDRYGEPLAMSRLSFPTLRSLIRGAFGFQRTKLPVTNSEAIVEVDAVSGGFLMIRREAWLQLGGFDERFFLYSEEVDLCRRLKDRGGRVGLVAAARMLHDVGSGNPLAPSRVLHSLRGSATFYRKHYTTSYARACLLAQWLSCALRFTAGAVAGPFNPRLAALSRAMRPATLNPSLWTDGYS